MFWMFPCSNTPVSNEWVVIKLHRSLITTHLFESGVLEQGNIYNMKDRGPEDSGHTGLTI